MRNLLFVFLSLALFSCNDDNPVTPQCIEDQLADFQTTADCIGDNLASWEFEGETVYCFAYGTCLSVGVADIYDASCTLICTMGGAGGLQTCNGVPWVGNATNETLIWRKSE